jgi:hypothetical protein
VTLSIPDIDPDQDTLSAALAYARAGWYVLPVDQATKHAGSVLGKGWPAKSSRDPETLIAWFAGTDLALALHVGRSGAVCFDVDRPTELPDLLRAALLTVPPPYQSTREHDPERGHYLYAVPDGRSLGNSNGQLGKAWGEVRGKNGIVVVAPSIHEKHEQGGRYEWARGGMLPMLPEVLAEQLPDAGDSSDAATDREVLAFLNAHTGNARPELLSGVLKRWDAAVQAGESRHGATLTAAAWAMREAAAGLYPAIEAAQKLRTYFTMVMSVSRDDVERTLTPGQAGAEFGGILAWAIAQTVHTSPETTAAAVDERAPRDDFTDLLPPDHPYLAQQAPPPFAEPGMAADEPPVDEHGVDIEALAFERMVAEELRRIKVREEAARRAKKARTGNIAPPAPILLTDFLNVADEPARYRIDQLWPVGGRIMLAAQFKAGKTTMVGNLVRSLADSMPFLGKYDVNPCRGRIVIIDDELDERMLRSWLRDQGIAHTDSIAVIPLRGRLSTFDLLDPETRTRWADVLRALDASIVIFDCLAPILDALGLSEDKEAGRLLVAFDELIREADAEEAAVIHHMGHSGERSRGASRLRDWPDVEWRLVREKDEMGETDPAAPRYFSAYGRDVDVPESLLSFEASTRRLEIAGGSRKDAKTESAADAILDFLTLSPSSSGRQIEDALVEAHAQKAIRDALKRLTHSGHVVAVDGPRRAKLHSLNPNRASALSALPVRQRTCSECVSASIETHCTHYSPDPRDPYDLLTHSHADNWTQIDGEWVNTTTAEIRSEPPR